MFAVLVLSGCGGLRSFASSNFENDAEDWQLSGNGDTLRPSLVNTGGNPGAAICGTDAKDGDVWYFVAPGRYLGNASTAFGKKLTFDMKQSSIFNQLKGRDVVLNGPGLALLFNLRETPGLDWTPYLVSLDDTSGWLVEATREAATADEMRTVLGNLTALRIRGEYYDGPDDRTCLDNVYFGVELNR